MIFVTLRVDTPWTYISAKATLSARSDLMPFSKNVYGKNLSATELLDEICKRDILNNHLTPMMPLGQQEASFLRIIVENTLIPASAGLKKVTPRAIKPISVFEILNMANQIKRSQWYQTLEDKQPLEELLHTLVNEQPLNNKLLIQQALSSKQVLDDILVAKETLANEKWVLVQEKALLQGQLKQMQRELTS
jgi:hypothetical protein